jgi:hypothetical protein
MQKSILLSCLALFCLLLPSCRQTHSEQQTSQRIETADNAPISSNYQKIAELPKKLKEVSGMVLTKRGFFVLEDSGKPFFYRIDTATGSVVQRISVKNIDFEDKESLTADDDYLYIGDFGNNKDERKNLQIVRVPLEALADTAAEMEIEAQIISFHYPEQEAFNSPKDQRQFDCEAMIAMGESLYLFTKRRNDDQTVLYRLPKQPTNESQLAQKIAQFDSQGRITGASLSPDNKTLLLIGYQEKRTYPFLWKFEGFEGERFFEGKAQKIVLSQEPIEWQTESVAFIDEQQFFFSCEKTDDIPATIYSSNLQMMFGK